MTGWGNAVTTAQAPAVLLLEMGEAAGRVRVDANGLLLDIPLPAGTVGMFRSDPPRESEIESAIDRVEEAVMPLAKVLPPGATLVAGNALTRRVAAVAAGSDAVESVAVAAVEALFEQVAMGARRGFWSGEQRMDGSLAAGALILREFMDHLGFDRIEVPAEADDGA